MGKWKFAVFPDPRGIDLLDFRSKIKDFLKFQKISEIFSEKPCKFSEFATLDG